MNEEFKDACLTQLGIDQCIELSKKTTDIINNAELLLVSPLRRTIQTATYSFSPHINKIPLISLESLREASGLHPCDKRSPIDENKTNYPHIDFSNFVENEDTFYSTNERESSESVQARGHEFLLFLKSRIESNIIVVTHSTYLMNLMTHVIKPQNEDFKKFANCELRSYIIE